MGPRYINFPGARAWWFTPRPTHRKRLGADNPYNAPLKETLLPGMRHDRRTYAVGFMAQIAGEEEYYEV